MPLVGTRASTTLILKKAWMRIVSRDAEGHEAGKGILREDGRAHAAPADEDEEPDDDQRPNQSQFLGNVREDVVGVRLGQIKELLPAIHVAHAAESP